MKRRAQAGVTPPVAKKPKLAKDEVETGFESERPSVLSLPYRPSKSRNHTAVVPIVVLDDSSSSSSSTLSHSSAEVSAGRAIAESVPLASNRSSSNHATKNASQVTYSIAIQKKGANRPTTTPAESSFPSPAASLLPSPISLLPATSPTPTYIVCWARVNRCPWWPGKVCSRST